MALVLMMVTYLIKELCWDSLPAFSHSLFPSLHLQVLLLHPSSPPPPKFSSSHPSASGRCFPWWIITNSPQCKTFVLYICTICLVCPWPQSSEPTPKIITLTSKFTPTMFAPTVLARFVIVFAMPSFCTNCNSADLEFRTDCIFNAAGVRLNFESKKPTL